MWGEPPARQAQYSPGGVVREGGTPQEVAVLGEEDLPCHAGVGAGPGDPSPPSVRPWSARREARLDSVDGGCSLCRAL